VLNFFIKKLENNQNNSFLILIILLTQCMVWGKHSLNFLMFRITLIKMSPDQKYYNNFKIINNRLDNSMRCLSHWIIWWYNGGIYYSLKLGMCKKTSVLFTNFIIMRSFNIRITLNKENKLKVSLKSTNKG